MPLPRALLSLLCLLLAGGALTLRAAPREQFEFPNPRHWEEFVARLDAVMASGDPGELARFAPEARRALAGLREFPGSDDYVAWLEERIDYLEMARFIDVPVPALRPPPKSANDAIPQYSVWLQRLRSRPSPEEATRYVESLRRIFVMAGVPGELVWLAEVESGFNPLALSPVGARGLFQLMPETARELGLSTTAPDERTDPIRCAEAAARRLRTLYDRFGDWALALAAYNAGAGLVQRKLVESGARDFAQVAPALPLETRMYVPKVLAVLQVRTGITLLASDGRR